MKICCDPKFIDMGVVMYLPQLPRLWQSLNKFYESILEIFPNKTLRVIKTVDKIEDITWPRGDRNFIFEC